MIGTIEASVDQLVSHEYNGLICRAGDAGNLAEKIKQMNALTDEELQKYRDNAKLRIVRNGSSVIVPQLVELYEKVISRKNKGLLQ